MSGKTKSRSATNADSVSGSMSCDERILRDCHQLYVEPGSGELADIFDELYGKSKTGNGPILYVLVAELLQQSIFLTKVS